MTRTPEERERMYALLWEAMHPGLPWAIGAVASWDVRRADFDGLLARFPQLWDSLPPDPAETARREAEEDGRMVEFIRSDTSNPILTPFARESAVLAVRIFDRMTARAAAGYPVLIAPKGEK